MPHVFCFMDTFSEKELERLRKLEQLRRLLQTILGSHLRALVAVFVVILTAILGTVYIKAIYSPERYEAQVILYYYPKQTKNISSYNAKYVLQVLARSTLRQQFLQENGFYGDDKKQAIPKLMVAAIEQRNRNVDHFDIRVSSRYKSIAIDLTNAFAEYCIRAYIDDRTANLQEMKNSLLKKKNDIFMNIQRLDREKSALGAPLNSHAMEKEHEHLRARLTELQSAHTKLSLAIGSLVNRCATLKKKQEQLNPELIANEKVLRDQINAMKKIDQEIMLAENLYTEHNPKMIALISRRDTMRERLKKFMGEKKINDNDFEHFEETVELSASLKSAQDELENRREEMQVLSRELKETSERLDRLSEIMPRVSMINQQYANLQDSLNKLDASISDINYLMPLVREDLRMNEPAVAAYGMMPFSKKNIFVCVFAAISLTMVLASLTVLLEFWIGRVSSEKELAAIPEFCYLGNLPASERMFESKRQEQIVFSSICHNFQTTDIEHHIVLAGALPGGRLISSIFEAFEWSYAMAGKRTLTIDMVLADNFDYEAYPPGDTGIIIYSGGKGFLPVVSKHYLSPSELMLIHQDLEILRKSYDLIFIRHSSSLRHDRLFLEQIVGVCDGALLAIGAKKTSRKDLRRLTQLHKKTKLPIMTILSGSTLKPSVHHANPEVGE